MATANRYKRLFSNTLILGLGTLCSKAITIILMPLYTHYMSNSEYGIVELLVPAANLLIPLVSLGMNNAVLRFAMDGETDRKTVLSTGLAIDLLGYGAFLLFFPLVRAIPMFSEYAVWLYVFVFSSMIHYLFAYFVKTLQKVRLFAVCNIIGTALTLLLGILFLAVLKIGIVGYMLAIVLSDTICVILFFIFAKLHRFISFRSIKKTITKAMLRYSIPLIPSTALWWVTDMSDRYMVAWIIDEGANGLYSISYKIPNLLILISGVFMDAWQMSILTEKSPLERQTFFSRIFSVYQSLIFVSSSVLILSAKMVTKILVAESFYDSWQFIPTLVIAMAISNMVSFIGTIYTVEKRTKSALWTTALGTVANVIGNYFLINAFGVQGAALSTALSYALVLLLRSIHTRRFIPIRWDLPRFITSSVLLIAQCVIMIAEVPYWIAIQCGLLTVQLVLHYKPLIATVKQVVGKKLGKDNADEPT